LASTSSGFAATLGRLDMTVGRDEVLDHVDVLAHGTDVPLNVDPNAATPTIYRVSPRPSNCWLKRARPDARSRTGTRRPMRSTRSMSPSHASAPQRLGRRAPDWC
jgi:hypothetical protein